MLNVECWFSFHDFGHDEQAVGPGGRIAQGLVVRQRRLDFIGARDVDHRHGMGGRLHAGDIQFIQLFDVAEDVTELRA